MCNDLPHSPMILDMGCGAGGQTLHLAALTVGTIMANDSHAPHIERLNQTIATRGLSHRVQWALHPARRSLVGRFLHANEDSHCRITR